ncbi:hypothetical protein BJV74DRAFT_736813, partial [Russula compacta]
AKLKEIWMQKAMEIYKEEWQAPKPQSLKAICQEVEDKCFHETGQKIRVSSSTL